jgi:hypothetical protein
MAFDMDHDFAGVAALLIPIVGSIALFSFLAVAAWAEARRKEREAYYRSETLKKIAESSAEGAKIAMELMREQEKPTLKKSVEGLKLGGLITAAVGIGLMAFLHAVDHDESSYMIGAIPLLIGLALLIYAFLLAPKPPEINVSEKV